MDRHLIDRSVSARGVGDGGASLVEYVLLLSLIALVALAALTAFGESNDASIDDSASRVVTAFGG